MTWLDILTSLRPADLSLLLAGVNVILLLANAASGWREVDLSPQACLAFYREAARRVFGIFLELDTRRLCRVDGRSQKCAQKTVTQNRAISRACLTLLHIQL